MTTDTTAAHSLDELCVNTIRTLSMDAVEQAKSGHPGTPMALAPLAYVLYTRLMRHDPGRPDWFDRDRFVLSAGHASMLLYSTLYLTGYGLELDDLRNFRQLGSPTAGHPEYGHAAGIEATTGPLGQGISNCVGLALAERHLAARFNRPGHEVIDHFTWTIASDGDLQEGVASEACSLAGHLGLGRLVAFYDDNHITIEGDTDLAFSEDVPKRFEAYGWHVQDLGEDLALDRIEAAARAAMEVEDRPSLIVCRTHIAPGAPNKQDTAGAHGAPLGEEEVRLTKEAYGWPGDEPFHVPDEVLAHFRRCRERGEDLSTAWEARLAAYRREHPELAAELERLAARRLPDGFPRARPPRVDPSETPAVATRKAGQSALAWAASEVPELLGGAADLGNSTLAQIPDGGSVRRGDYGGRVLHYGIREHGMGAIANGLTLHGLRGMGSTFLIFSDYMKPSIRLAGLMGIGSIFVFTHDSIGLGEDGPTHQPIEQLAGLRATPNVDVIRPADANETGLAWEVALRNTDRATCLALTRQGVPVLDPELIPDDAVERGAYVLRDGDDVALVGTGSEVHLCLAAADALADDGVTARVVSMPCVERFLAQPDDYREQVLPEALRARVVVEAASPLGWERIAGDHGEIVGMTTFGASAPAGDLFAHFGFTPERVAERARAALDRVREEAAT